MYSEFKLNTPELQELARQKIAQAVKDHPHLSVQARWNRVKEENPKLFGDLQAADWMADDEAKERETTCHQGAYGVSNWFAPDGVANDCWAIKKSKTPRRRRSA